MAPIIIQELGPHRSFWEPFCGGLSVLLAKDPCTVEVVSDLHGDLVNFARVLRDPAARRDLHRRLQGTLFCEAFFRESQEAIRSAGADPDALDVTRAYHFFLVSWMGLSGVAGTSQKRTGFARRYSSSGGDPALRVRNAIRSVPAWGRRLERVQILCTDGIEMCEKVEDRDGVAIYVDPPYFDKNLRYLHDFESSDHERLAAALRRFEETRVVASYYDHPRLAELYPGWSVRHVRVAKSMVNAVGEAKGRVEAPEVLLINGPLIGEARPVAPQPCEGVAT